MCVNLGEQTVKVHSWKCRKPKQQQNKTDKFEEKGCKNGVESNNALKTA